MGDKDLTKRAFLHAMAASLPGLKVVLGAASAPPRRLQRRLSKFTPLDCAPYFNASPIDVERGQEMRTPSGPQRFRGIPFALGPALADKKSWIALARSGRPAPRAVWKFRSDK